MKKLHFLIALLLVAAISGTTNAQKQSINEISISPPNFQNGEYENLTDYLQNTLVYPSTSINAFIEGTEVLRFSVTAAGNIADIEVINSVSEEIDKEVVQALKETSGKWQAGSIDGRAKTMTREVAISFVLNSYDDMLKSANNHMQKGNNLLFNKRKPEKALNYYRKAYTLFPYESGVASVTGLCLERLGRSEEARIMWDRIEELNQRDGSTLSSKEEELISWLDPVTIIHASTN